MYRCNGCPGPENTAYKALLAIDQINIIPDASMEPQFRQELILKGYIVRFSLAQHEYRTSSL